MERGDTRRGVQEKDPPAKQRGIQEKGRIIHELTAVLRSNAADPGRLVFIKQVSLLEALVTRNI